MKPAAVAFALLAGVLSATLGLARGSFAGEVNCGCLARVVCEQRKNCRDPSMRNCLTCKSISTCANWDVTLDFKSRKISVAAYSGCFIGKFQTTPSGVGTIIDAKNLPHYQGCNAKGVSLTKGSFKLYFNKQSYRYVLLEGGESVDYGQCRQSRK